MGRASSSKKVQRAARAAGRPGTGRNWLWPAAIVALVAVGISLVWVSRGTDQASAEAPTFGDHWHAAFGVYTCDEFTEQVVDQNGDANGFSLTDGPSREEGKDECDGKPGLVQLAVWDDLADEEPTIVTEDVADQKLGENALYTLAFAPEGADIPKPPSASNLAAPEDLAPQQQQTIPGSQLPTDSTAPGDTSTSAPPADGSTSTSSTPAAPSDSTTTPAP